nr:MAG: hypothetical protein [Bacteriophage sp.]
MSKPSKINVFAQALSRKKDLEACEHMLKTALAFCNNTEIDSLISKALEVINNERTTYNDAVAEARTAAQQVKTIFINDVPVEIPAGYDVKRVTMCGMLRLNVYLAEGETHIAQICTANADGSDVGGFIIWRHVDEQLPELFTSEQAALRFFFAQYVEA